MFVRQLADPSRLSRDPLRERRWTRRFIAVWMALLVFRLLLLALSPLQLSGDEAYYWEWGRRLDWGYFSKPPLIGWLMALFGWLGGDSTFGIRLGALTFGSLALLPLFFLGRRMFNAEAGFWGAVALALTPGNAAATFFFTIDAPLLLAWCLAMWGAWRLFEGNAWTAGSGGLLVVGLGAGLLTKQMMLVFPLLAFAHLVLEPRHRHWATRRGWWLTLAGSALFLLPPLTWNWQHDWITFAHTAGTNFQSPPVPLARHFARFGEFVAAQLVLLGPVLYGVLFWLLLRLLRCWGKLTPGERFLWLFSGPALVVFLLVALKMRALPNWPAVFYPAGYLLLGGWVAGSLSCARPGKAGRRLFQLGVAVGLILTLSVHLALFLLPRTGTEIGGKAPLRRLMGWQAYASEVAAVGERTFAGRPHALVVAGHRYQASELAFYHPDQPVVYVWNEEAHPQSQYDLWPGPLAAEPVETLIVVPHDDDGLLRRPRGLDAAYAPLDELGEIRVPLSEQDERRYTLYRGERRTTEHTP